MTPTEPLNARDAKANAKASAAYAKAQRPFWKKKRFFLPVLILVIIIGGMSVSGGGSDDPKTPSPTGVKSLSGNDKNPPAADVEVTACDYEDVIGTVKAQITITNHSSDRSNYLITINVEDGDGVKVGEVAATSSNVEGGQVAKEEGIGTVTGDKKPAGMKCVVKQVERFAS